MGSYCIGNTGHCMRRAAYSCRELRLEVFSESKERFDFAISGVAKVAVDRETLNALT